MGKVIYKRKGKISHIILNSAKKMNAVDEELIDGVKNGFIEFNCDPKALIAIISSSSRNFSVGADLSLGIPSVEFAKHTIDMLPSTIGVLKPTIAVIEGYCLGGGWEIAQDCDIRIASYECQFGIPEVRWNFIPPFCAGFTHHHLRPNIALEIILTGRNISSQKAYQIGFINKIVNTNKENIMRVAIEIANKMIAIGMNELIHRKKDFNAFMMNQPFVKHKIISAKSDFII
jgi:enoyl-CoA hydratase/carnithine racemase